MSTAVVVWYFDISSYVFVVDFLKNEFQSYTWVQNIYFSMSLRESRLSHLPKHSGCNPLAIREHSNTILQL